MRKGEDSVNASVCIRIDRARTAIAKRKRISFRYFDHTESPLCNHRVCKNHRERSWLHAARAKTRRDKRSVRTVLPINNHAVAGFFVIYHSAEGMPVFSDGFCFAASGAEGLAATRAIGVLPAQPAASAKRAEGFGIGKGWATTSACCVSPFCGLTGLRLISRPCMNGFYRLSSAGAPRSCRTHSECHHNASVARFCSVSSSASSIVSNRMSFGSSIRDRQELAVTFARIGVPVMR